MEISKPDFQYVWASGGAIVAPSNVKIQTGWTAEVPPFQWENWSQNRQDQAIAHVLQKGISEWDSLSNYYFTASGVRSYVQGSNGTIYVAVADSLNQNPVTDTSNTYWKKAFASPEDNLLRAGVIGSVRNLKMAVNVVAATATVTADEITVKSSYGGNSYILPSFNKSINLATTGAGGLDTGTSPINGYVALYAIYNPTTSVSALLAVNATSVVVANVYAGVNMPAGYTASALLTVVPTQGGGQFKLVLVVDRAVSIATVNVFATSSAVTNVPISIAPACPPNAIEISGTIQLSASTASNLGLGIVSNTNQLGEQNVSLSNMVAGQSILSNFSNVLVVTPSQVVVTSTVTAGTPSISANITGYRV